MNKDYSLLIMIHCEQFTGYAVGVLEQVFLDAALRAGFSPEHIFWSFKTVSDNTTGKMIACDYRGERDYEYVTEFVRVNNIQRVIAFDLPYPAPVIAALKHGGVKKIISYWGASMSSINSGLKLALKQIEWVLRSDKPNEFIFESEAMRLTATQGRGVPFRATHVIPLGVDTNKFTPRYDQDFYAHSALAIPEHRKIIFYSGHMEERKGVRVIVSAAKKLVDECGISNLHFVLCGNKGDEANVYLAQLADSKAKEHVTFAGYRDDIAALMRSSYVGVIASTGWDSFTMSSVEMMASGLPLIVSNLQGLAETIENGVNGYHLEPGNSEQLAERIRELLDQPEKAKQFSHASRDRAVKLFSRDRQTNNISQFLV